MEKAFALVNVRTLTCCASTTRPTPRLKAEPGGGRSRGHAGEMASWRSEQQCVPNGCSLSHGSSGSMIWEFLFGIWSRIFDKSELVFSL